MNLTSLNIVECRTLKLPICKSGQCCTLLSLHHVITYCIEFELIFLGTECHASPILTHLRSFAISLLEAFKPMGALSADDLSTARCSCLLSLPLSVFSLHPEDGLFDQLAHVISFTCQLAGLQVRCVDLAIAAASAVESWLNG